MASLRYSDLFDKAWGGMRNQLPLVVGLTLVFVVAYGAMMLVPVFGHLLGMPLVASYLHSLLRVRDGKSIDYQDFFWCFMDFNRTLHYYLLSFIFLILVGLGTMLLVIPGIYLGVSLFLAMTYFVVSNQDAVESLKAVRQFSIGHWWFLAGLVLIDGLLLALGTLCFGVGILFTLPLTMLLNVAAVEALSGGVLKAAEVVPNPSL